MNYTDFEAVIGLEVHAELKTDSKIFCSCATTFGAEPNTQVCPVCMGLPGAMPRLNRRAVELAVMAGLVLHCDISEYSRMDRKQYFYPDLPKAYQISQGDQPLCQNGYLDVQVNENSTRVGIRRIHMEEDAGKLMHTDRETLVDYNRCGIGLIEIVSEPSIRSGAEAAAYLRSLRSILSACNISDCKMQEGSMRCDVNVSVRKKGSDAYGVRTEIKNLNSFAFVEKAIDYEFTRQCELLNCGEAIVSETRRFDPSAGKTYSMRSKESVSDYRFLVEPDIPLVWVTRKDVDRIAKEIPELPHERVERLCSLYAMRRADAEIVVSYPMLADYYESVAQLTEAPQVALNLILGELLRTNEGEVFSTPVLPKRLAELCDLLHRGVINNSTAKKLLARLQSGDFDLVDVIERESLSQIRDEGVIAEVLTEILNANARAVQDYCNGKRAAMRALQGQAMAKTDGRADPVLLERILIAMLDKRKEEGEQDVSI